MDHAGRRPERVHVIAHDCKWSCRQKKPPPSSCEVFFDRHCQVYRHLLLNAIRFSTENMKRQQQAALERWKKAEAERMQLQKIAEEKERQRLQRIADEARPGTSTASSRTKTQRKGTTVAACWTICCWIQVAGGTLTHRFLKCHFYA